MMEDVELNLAKDEHKQSGSKRDPIRTRNGHLYFANWIRRLDKARETMG